MTALQVFAVIKSWVKTYVIPTNAVPLPLPRNQLAADVQNTLQKADQEPISRQAQIDDLNHEIQSTNQSLQTTDANLSGLNQNVIAINEDLQKTNLSLWGTDGDNGKIATLVNQNNSQQNSLADHKERIENLESDLTDHVENEDIHVTLQDKNKWDTAASGGIAEAPKDGKQYARQDGDWSEIEGGGYEPPVGGIPRIDLSQDVQTSLGKADSALQSFTETDPVYLADKPSLALKSEMETADTALENRIAQNETDISNNKINSLSFNQPTKVLSVNTGNDTISETLPEATSTMAGLMASADVVALNQNTQDIQSLKAFAFVPLGTLSVTNETFALMLDSGKDAQVLADLGVSTFTDNDAIKTSDGITWIVANSSTVRTWKQWGDTPVHTATNDSLGIVKGTENSDGKIYVESDGSMSLKGFDTIKSDITNLQSNKLNNSHNTDVNSHTDIRTTLNGKQVNIPASTNGYLVTHSGTTGTFGTPINPNTFLPKTSITVASGTDLNTLTNGVYYISGAVYPTLLNAPVANQGDCTVRVYDTSSGYNTQLFYAINGCRMFMRAGRLSSGYSDWIEIASFQFGKKYLNLVPSNNTLTITDPSITTKYQGLEIVISSTIDITTGLAINLNGVNKWVYAGHTTGTRIAAILANTEYRLRSFGPNNDWELLDYYGTMETLTGEIYLDGKPIYRRAFTGNITAAANTANDIVLLTGVDTIVASGGQVSMSNGFALPVNMPNFANQVITVLPIFSSNVYKNASGAVRLGSVENAARTNAPYSIWVEYTRTT